MNPATNATSDDRSWRILILSVAYYVFLTGGIVTVAYSGFSFLNSHSYEAREQRAFENSRLNDTAENQTPYFVTEGGVIGEIQIARLGLKAIIVQGDSSEILEHAVGHLSETPLPGQAGNIALAGHRDTLFRPLKDIVPGDAITLKTPRGNFEYSVESTRVVPPTAVEVVQPSDGRLLTLVTCYPFYYVGAAPNRFIVRARQIENWP